MGCHFLLQGIFLVDPGIKPSSLVSPALAGGFFTTSTTWEAPAHGINFCKKHFGLAGQIYKLEILILKPKFLHPLEIGRTDPTRGISPSWDWAGLPSRTGQHLLSCSPPGPQRTFEVETQRKDKVGNGLLLVLCPVRLLSSSALADDWPNHQTEIPRVSAVGGVTSRLSIVYFLLSNTPPTPDQHFFWIPSA